MEDDHEISGNNRTDIIVVVDVRLDASCASVHTHADAQPVHCEVAHNLVHSHHVIVELQQDKNRSSV